TEELQKEIVGKTSQEKLAVIDTIVTDLLARLNTIIDLGLGYLSTERSTPSLSPGELQRLRLATQVRSNLFGVVYVMDEPSAGLHPADTAALLRALDKLKESGNSLFIVEHEPDIINHADWVIDVGPGAGFEGGEIVFSGTRNGLLKADNSITGINNVRRNNLQDVSISIPLSVITCVTGVSGSGKSSLVSQVLVELLSKVFGQQPEKVEETDVLQEVQPETISGSISGDLAALKRMVLVDQKPIGRTPRSNLATYTGLFDEVRKLFAATPLAKKRKYNAGRFSFNIAAGNCSTCSGEGFVMVELLFLPSVYAPCPTCNGQRYNKQTLEVLYKEKNIAEVLALTVDEAATFFEEDDKVLRAVHALQHVGLGYLRLGQPATELSGGEAQRIKLATELQRNSNGQTIYILDEPTTGLHPHDVHKLLQQLHLLADKGNTVVLVEHDMDVLATADHVIDIGPGAGNKGGRIVFTGAPAQLVKAKESITGKYLAKHMDGGRRG
ncbi:MAG: ATP-binding cassette domain-containing protein, partial [Chitinophagaceae bacterium]